MVAYISACRDTDFLLGTIAPVHRGGPTEIGSCPFPIARVPPLGREPSYEGFYLQSENKCSEHSVTKAVHARRPLPVLVFEHKGKHPYFSFTVPE